MAGLPTAAITAYAAKSLIITNWQKVESFFTGKGSAIHAMSAQAVEPLDPLLISDPTSLAANIAKAFSGLKSDASEFTKWANESIAAPVEAVFNSIRTWFNKNMPDLANTFANLPGDVMKLVNILVFIDFEELGNSMAAALVKAFANVGADIVNSIVSGIKAATSGGGIARAVGKAFLSSTIPGLAEGGLVSRPTLAVVGESGPELVVPLSALGLGGGSLPGVGALGGVPLGTGVGGAGVARCSISYNTVSIANAGGLLLQPGSTSAARDREVI